MSRTGVGPPARRRGRRREQGQLFGKTLFVDLMMGTLVVMTCLLMASNAVKKKADEQQEAALNTEGQFAIVADWPDKNEDDVDLYVRNPRGDIVFFRGKEAGLMHLEYDDKGIRGDQTESDGQTIGVDRNSERVIIRAIIPGEYVVNLHMFRKAKPGPTPVKVRLVRLKGADKAVFREEITLTERGEEQTVFRFTLSADRKVTDVNRLPLPFIGSTVEQQGGPN